MTDVPLRWCYRLYVGMQYLLPHHPLSAMMFGMTRVRWRPFKSLLIRGFIRRFRVDMTEALESDPALYASFNDFFTRALRPGTRPIAGGKNAVVSPADGALSQLGTIGDGRIFQAKGHAYSLLELLGGHAHWAERLDGGAFATIYLSPRDYHRVHMPLAGELREMIHVPGRLFSVNPVTTSLVPRLFARNERVLCLFEGEAGPMAVILVGAIFVGGMDTVWAGQVTPTGGRNPSDSYDKESAPRLAKGEEMGCFNMGSTVILLFPPGAIRWDGSIRPGDRLRVGQQIGCVERQGSETRRSDIRG
jgi:phosphatidylserine decarboxylase